MAQPPEQAQPIVENAENLQSLYHVLKHALQADETVRKPAEKALESLEIRPGFLTLLLNVSGTSGVDTEVRWLAMLCFKNTVIKYWRRRGGVHVTGAAISEQEKDLIRPRLLSSNMLSEPHSPTAVQIALIISKISRLDYPHSWPNLFPTLIEVLQRGSEQEQRGALLVVNHVLKELSSKALVMDKQNFKQLSHQLIDFCYQLWTFHTKIVLNNLLALQTQGFDMQRFSVSSEASIRCVKIMRRLIMFGIQEFHSNQNAAAFMHFMLDTAKQLISFRNSVIQLPLEQQSRFDNILPPTEKFILQCCKTAIGVQQKQPLSFKDYLVPYLEFFCTQIWDHAVSPVKLDMLAICSMLFLKAVTSERAYEVNNPTQVEAECQRIVHEIFFTDALLFKLQDTLIRHDLVMTEDELEEWQHDPEGYLVECEINSFNETLKPCAENLFLSLLTTFRTRLAPAVITYINNILQETAGSLETPKILLRDAAYLAIGIGSYELYDYIGDFIGWYRSQLRGEILNTDPRLKIVRRRATWLVGKWVEKIDKTSRKDIYASIYSALCDPDIVIKATAVKALHSLVDDFQFYVQDFIEFLDPYIKKIFELLLNSEKMDTKLQTLNSISVLIEKMEDKILPFAPQMMECLPPLWEKADKSGENLMKIAIIVALTKLISTMGNSSVGLYPVVLPLIAYSSDVDQPDQIYLLSDGLELWYRVMECATESTPQLLELFPLLIKLLQRNFDELPTVLRIIESYILIGQSQFMQLYATSLSDLFLNIIGNVKEKATLYCVGVLETLLLEFPQEGPRVLDLTLQKILSEMFTLVARKESDIVVSHYLTLLARVLLCNKEYFFAFFEKLQNQQNGTNKIDVFGHFLNIWLDRCDSIVSGYKRKLTALSLATLLLTQEMHVMNKFPEIFNLLVEILYETNSDDLEYQNYSSSEPEDDEDIQSVHFQGASSESEKKKTQLINKDPVMLTDIFEFTKAILQSLAQAVGQEKFNALINLVDPKVVQQFHDYKKKA